ncbi:MAG: hypothetical protein HOM24_00410 [Flavobacteriales bacterium]|jgi:hypothetical protein|nr:hypothetical protein [Flavobacteriales bacterium]MBT5750613.1 hypothetical protein [Flavobacteriales bacterium]
MNKQQILLLSSFLMLTVSCFNNEYKQIIASVNEKDLLLSEVLKEMPEATKDSIFFVERYMNLWIRKQLMIYHAEINLNSDLLGYEKQISEYRSSLLIYAYQQELINQNFDTSITEQEISDYYNQYKEEFKLVKNVFMGRYIVVDKSAPKLRSLSKWYKSYKTDNIENLTDYCQQFAKEYSLADSSWQYFSTINNKLPEFITEEKYFLENTKGIWFEDEQYRHYIYIRDYQIKGSISPLALEREKIRNVLLNKNKIQYLKKLEDELYQNALALKKIKIY